jgi:hypothetical protein
VSNLGDQLRDLAGSDPDTYVSVEAGPLLGLAAAVDRQAEALAEKAGRLARAHDDLTRTRQALDAIARERNTWARQQADLRDGLDAQRAYAAQQRDQAAAATTERDVLVAALDELLEGDDLDSGSGIARRLRAAVERAREAGDLAEVTP